MRSGAAGGGGGGRKSRIEPSEGRSSGSFGNGRDGWRAERAASAVHHRGIAGHDPALPIATTRHAESPAQDAPLRRRRRHAGAGTVRRKSLREQRCADGPQVDPRGTAPNVEVDVETVALRSRHLGWHPLAVGLAVVLHRIAGLEAACGAVRRSAQVPLLRRAVAVATPRVPLHA